MASMKPKLTAIATQTGKLRKTNSGNVSIEMVENIVQKFITNQTQCSQDIEKSNKLIGDKLANMITLANFEGKMTELMLQNKYYMDSRGKKAFDQIRENARKSIIIGMERVSDTTNLKLLEDIESITIKNNELQEAMNEGKQREAELQQEIKILRAKTAKSDGVANMAMEGLKSYAKLTEWHEKLVKEVPIIRKRNSGIIRVQTWEGAVECYIRDNPKPKVTGIDNNDFW